jgi:tripartite-type tricarboxylate transporter receptor subunit TctC
MLRFFAALFTAFVWMTSSGAFAQANYPTRTITLIVPFAAGGPTDIIARIISQSLTQSLGQSVIVDNRPGGGGNLGIAMVARANPDGHTLLLTSTAIAVNPGLFTNLPYDPIKDFAPISRVHSVPLVLLAGQKMDIHSVKELIERAKTTPGKLTIASAGIGTMNHFAIELFGVTAGVKVLHVPYKGGGPALSDLLGGQVAACFEQLNSSMDLIKDGRVRPLAITSLKRSLTLPNIPTLDEMGLKGYEAATFVGVLAPAATPKAVVNNLNQAVRKVLNVSSAVNRLRDLGTEPGSSTPEEFGVLVANELNKWRDVATRAGLKFE